MLSANLDTVAPAETSLRAGQVLLLRGWVRDDVHPVEQVRLTLGGAEASVAFPIARKDVAEASGDPSAVRSGFVGSITTEGLPATRHQVRLEAFVAGIWTTALTYDFEIACPPAPVLLDFHVDDLVVGDQSHIRNPTGVIPVPADAALGIRGWCVDRRAESAPPLLRLRVGSVRVEAAVGLRRPDVATHHAKQGYEYVGFVGNIPANALAPGTHALVLDTTLDGISGPREVFTHISFRVTA